MDQLHMFAQRVTHITRRSGRVPLETPALSHEAEKGA